MFIVSHTAARLLFERPRFAMRQSDAFAHPWGDAIALSAGGVCQAGTAKKPQTGVGISRGDPAP